MSEEEIRQGAEGQMPEAPENAVEMEHADGKAGQGAQIAGSPQPEQAQPTPERSESAPRRLGSRPSVKASGARMAVSSGEPRPKRTRPSVGGDAERAGSASGGAPTPRAGRSSRPSASGAGARQGQARQGQARHHLLTNTTYTRPSAQSAQGAQRQKPRAQGATGAGAAEAAASAFAKVREVLGALGSRIDGLLSKLPFPKSYVYIALGALLLAIILAVAVSTCSAPAVEQGQSEAQDGQSEQQDAAADGIDEALLWRDSDFAVDPARKEWKTGDNGRKVVYLTIDDGPSDLTEQFLDLLDSYDAKATFFVTGHDPEHYGLIREAYKRGHTIGLHSMTHDYAQVYASEDAFFSDLDQVGRVVSEQIGYVPCFIRFPGGSSNTRAEGYSQGLMPKLTEAVQTQGYQYFDWNVDTGDGANLTKDQIIEAVKSAELDTNIILLCHDSATKQGTLEALPAIIEYYRDLGYTFEALDRDTWVCHHAVYTSEGEGEEASASAQSAEAGAQAAEEAESYDEGESYYEEPYEEESYTEETYTEEVYADDEGDYEYEE